MKATGLNDPVAFFVLKVESRGRWRWQANPPSQPLKVGWLGRLDLLGRIGRSFSVDHVYPHVAQVGLVPTKEPTPPTSTGVITPLATSNRLIRPSYPAGGVT